MRLIRAHPLAAGLAALAVAGATAVALSHGGGSGHAKPAGPSRQPPAAGEHVGGSKSRAERVAAVRKAAEAEAKRLVSLATAGGASPLRSAPSDLPGPEMGTPAAHSLAQVTKLWRVPMPFEETRAWLEQNPPSGLKLDGTSSGNGPQGPSFGHSYKDHLTRSWESAELDLSIAPYGEGASVLRADGLVVWLDPRPVRDIAHGKRIHISVANGCPPSDRRVVGVRNPGVRGLEHELVPRDDPTAGLVCSYDGQNGHAFRLRHQTRLDREGAAKLADAARRLRLSHVDGEQISCPADLGYAAVVAFSYPGRPDVDLWAYLTGCPWVANGQIEASMATLPLPTSGR